MHLAGEPKRLGRMCRQTNGAVLRGVCTVVGVRLPVKKPSKRKCVFGRIQRSWLRHICHCATPELPQVEAVDRVHRMYSRRETMLIRECVSQLQGHIALEGGETQTV
jgi:hypothetical protein